MQTKQIFASLLFLFGSSAWAMPEEPLRLVVWKHGESIAGEEFLTSDEATADYVSSLPRPTQGLDYFKYDCVGKHRGYRASLTGVGPNAPQGTVIVQMLYSLRDCKQVTR